MKKHRDLVYIISVILVAALISSFAVGFQIGYVVPAPPEPEPENIQPAPPIYPQQPENPTPPLDETPSYELRQFPQTDTSKIISDPKTGLSLRFTYLNHASNAMELTSGEWMKVFDVEQKWVLYGKIQGPSPKILYLMDTDTLEITTIESRDPLTQARILADGKVIFLDDEDHTLMQWENGRLKEVYRAEPYLFLAGKYSDGSYDFWEGALGTGFIIYESYHVTSQGNIEQLTFSQTDRRQYYSADRVYKIVRKTTERISSPNQSEATYVFRGDVFVNDNFVMEFSHVSPRATKHFGGETTYYVFEEFFIIQGSSVIENDYGAMAYTYLGEAVDLGSGSNVSAQLANGAMVENMWWEGGDVYRSYRIFLRRNGQFIFADIPLGETEGYFFGDGREGLYCFTREGEIARVEVL